MPTAPRGHGFRCESPVAHRNRWAWHPTFSGRRTTTPEGGEDADHSHPASRRLNDERFIRFRAGFRNAVVDLRGHARGAEAADDPPGRIDFPPAMSGAGGVRVGVMVVVP